MLPFVVIQVNVIYQQNTIINNPESEYYGSNPDIGPFELFSEKSTTEKLLSYIFHWPEDSSNYIFEDVDICEGENYLGWTTSVQYIREFTPSPGNDGIITTNLTAHEFPNPEFTFDIDTLTSLNSHSSYQWYDQEGQIQDPFILMMKIVGHFRL